MKYPPGPLRAILHSRWMVFVLLPLALAGWMAFSIPGGLPDLLLRLQIWGQAGLVTGAAYLISKALAGNVSGENAAELATRSGSRSAGLVFIGLCVLRGSVFVGLLLFFALQARAAEPAGPPAAALQHLPTLRAQIDSAWPDLHRREYLGGLVEHESCITLTHPRCWQATARLKTQREEGAGLGQLTRAWRTDGSLRFDALADAKRLDPAGLAALRWDTVYQLPDLQLRVIVLTQRANFARLAPLAASPDEALAMADAAYNGGLLGLLNERRACSALDDCDPRRWRGHVERTCLKSKAPLYGTRSACQINRHHVADVWRRMSKYIQAMA